MQKIAFLFCALIGLSASVKLPGEFKICKRTDPGLEECLRVAIQDAFPLMKNGIAGLDSPPLDGLRVPEVTIEAGKGPVNVQQKYTNVKLSNLVNNKVDKVEASIGDTLKLHMHLSVPEVVMEADYDFNGRILLLPIVGTGKCKITLVNPKTELILDGEKIEKKGKTYMQIKDFKVVIEPEKVVYHFENLFNGDERLGNEMNKVLNDNWKDVYEDVRSGYETFIASIAKHLSNTIFTRVPYDDMFPQ